MRLHHKIILISAINFLSSTIHAQAFLMNDNNLRSDLNWLNQQGVIQVSTSTWPLSKDEIIQALKNAKVVDNTQQKVIDAVQQKISEGTAPISATIGTSTTQNKLPSSFGDSNTAQSKAGLTLQQSSDNWDAHLQLNLEANQRVRTNSPFNMNGSYIAGKVWNQWLSFGNTPVWWGPGHDGSLIRGDATRPMPGFTVQRAEQKAFENKWLSWIGPWQYQVFAGQFQHYTAIPDTKLLGMRVTVQPFQSLELGASRVLQIGGRGQPDSFKAYWNAMIGNDNSCQDANCDANAENASNQLAGFDARLNLKPLLNIPVGVYGQMIGEDESGKLPAKNLYLAGIDYSSSIYDKPYQFYVEWANTKTDGVVKGYSYTHHQYTAGYYQYGFPVGHGIGGDGEMYSLGGNLQLDAMNRLDGKLLYAEVNPWSDKINNAYPNKDTIRALALTWDHQFKPNYHLEFKGWLGHSHVYNGDSGISLALKLPINF
ncbi:hypothetical protein P256_01984 [Acinetobacter nectaris CIP 110549]|uniref:Capsule assembly Wzi family protein n=1 Tax=Acinetobacter nectaris CIP 110549 TaxID=1392540 RepID=V2TQY1_9GAMM|nr:capsule assembly Wzi family protein [Acinetobacter nectaris]ESK38445.1 hypothetical protein P256_01984 [Acinetobacter nectaris CIP 110549]